MVLKYIIYKSYFMWRKQYILNNTLDKPVSRLKQLLNKDKDTEELDMFCFLLSWEDFVQNRKEKKILERFIGCFSLKRSHILHIIY